MQTGSSQSTSGKSTGQILRDAAARVRRGWLQGYVSDMAGRVCAYGAFAEAQAGIGLARWNGAREASEVVQRVLRLPMNEIDGPCAAVTEWNDAKGQTAEAVANALEFCAVILEQEEALAQVAQPVTGTR